MTGALVLTAGLAAVAVASVAAATGAGAGAAPETAEEIIRAEPRDENYSEARRCLHNDRITRVRVLSDRHIVFELPRSERWLVQLPVPCPGLRPNAKLVLEHRGTRLCEMDTVRVLFESGLGSVQSGPSCQLSSFEPVSRDQIDALRQAIADERRRGS